MPKHPHKFKILLDENVESRKLFPKLNSFHNVRHLASDYKKSGLLDPQVFTFAKHEKRILITYNYKDFLDFEFTNDVGLIGISHTLSFAEIDKKLMSFLRYKTDADLYGKKHFISGETKKKS